MKDIPQLDRVAAPARLPEQAHIGAVHLQIRDLERSVEYYHGVLGLDVLERGAGLASLGVRGAAPLAYSRRLTRLAKAATAASGVHLG